jgi:hypothetical protein
MFYVGYGVPGNHWQTYSPPGAALLAENLGSEAHL